MKESTLRQLPGAVVAVRALDAPCGEIPESERALAAAAGSDRRRREILAGRAAAHEALDAAFPEGPAVAVLSDAEGRPRIVPPIAGVFVSIAHDGGLAAAAAGEAPLGVDLAPFSRTAQAGRVVEALVKSGRAFAVEGRVPWPHLMVWTAREAMAKRLGTGVLDDRLAVRLEPSPCGEDWVARTDKMLLRWWFEEAVLVCVATTN